MSIEMTVDQESIVTTTMKGYKKKKRKRNKKSMDDLKVSNNSTTIQHSSRSSPLSHITCVNAKPLDLSMSSRNKNAQTDLDCDPNNNNINSTDDTSINTHEDTMEVISCDECYSSKHKKFRKRSYLNSIGSSDDVLREDIGRCCGQNFKNLPIKKRRKFLETEQSITCQVRQSQTSTVDSVRYATENMVYPNATYTQWSGENVQCDESDGYNSAGYDCTNSCDSVRFADGDDIALNLNINHSKGGGRDKNPSPKVSQNSHRIEKSTLKPVDDSEKTEFCTKRKENDNNKKDKIYQGPRVFCLQSQNAETQKKTKPHGLHRNQAELCSDRPDLTPDFFHHEHRHNKFQENLIVFLENSDLSGQQGCFRNMYTSNKLYSATKTKSQSRRHRIKYNAPVEENDAICASGPAMAEEETQQTEDPKLERDIEMAVIADDDGDLPLHIAAAQEELVALRRLIYLMSHTNINIDAPNNLRQSALHIAVVTGNRDVIDTLVTARASPDLQDRNGNSCVHLAVCYGNRPCLSALLKADKKPDLNMKNYDGLCPIHLAVQKGRLDMLTSLLDLGCDVNAQEGKSGRTALSLAAELGHVDMVDLLLLRASNVNSQSYSGTTALHMASSQGNGEIAAQLVRYGADTTIKNSNFDTPLTLAKNEQTASAIRTTVYEANSQSTGRSRSHRTK